MTRAHPIVAIDGPAASGKGTLARKVADALGLPYLDTGLLYRATARRMLDAGGEDAGAAEAAARALVPADLARTDLRTPEVDRAASRVAAIPAVRAALLDRQRDFARRRGAVLDGRDIGTVVFPDADVKLFVTASAAERARRRLRQRGEATDPAATAAEQAALEARDRADRDRGAAPLAQAPDSVLLDTTSMTPEVALAAALDAIRARIGRRDA